MSQQAAIEQAALKSDLASPGADQTAKNPAFDALHALAGFAGELARQS